MLKPVLPVLLLLLCYGVSFAQEQTSTGKGALRFIQKGKWQKAESKLRKSLAKESLNPSTRYALSVFYFHPENPGFHLDSAYHYVVTALEAYNLSPNRDRDKLKRAGLDSLTLISLRARIDSTAFEAARSANTEAAYLEFLSHFPSAVQRDLAAELRDEVAYQDAVRENTFRAFKAYLTRYPESKRAPEALAHYHRLLFFEETKDQRLSSFEKFLVEHPETPYRHEIYRNIFEISTAEGTVESFISFMTRYPVSSLVKTAGQMAFQLLAEQEDPVWPAQFLNDSLRNLLSLNEIYLVPYLKNGLYGFMDERGREIIPPRFKTIHPDYLCGYVTDEVLILDNELVARNGSPMFRGDVKEYSDLGAGFLKVTTTGAIKIIHKGGFLLADSVEDARIISKAFIAVKRYGGWFIHTLAGRRLDKRSWKEISALGEVIVFSDENRKFLVPKKQLFKSAEAVPLLLSEPFDEIRQWPEGLIWGRSGDFQGVLNQSLQSVIGFDRHILTVSQFGAIAQLPNGVRVYNWNGRKSSTFDNVIVLGSRIAVKESRSWFFLEPDTHQIEGRAYDSLKAEGPFVVATREDTVYVLFEGNNAQAFYKPQKISFVPGMDSTSFLLVQGATADKTLFDFKGKKLFTAVFDAIEYAGNGIFVITKKDLKGMVNISGENLLPADFDAIGSVKGQVVSVLKNKKFGAYQVDSRRFIKPQYDRNLIPYGSSALITFKDGRYGLLGWDNKAVSHFDYEEIMYWNDSLALVRQAGLWNLFDMVSRKLTETRLSSINIIHDDAGEKIAIVEKDKNFGVISSRGMVVIPITFSDVINLGSGEAPLYFTEKHIDEASLYIVIYYDHSGNMLRKEIYDDAGDYDRIYCSNQ